MNDRSNMDDSPSPKRMKITPPIYQLPIELLTKIIEKLPRTQWPALELVDPRGLFRDAVLLAWKFLRVVDIERDFIYSETKIAATNDENEPEMAEERLRREIAQKRESLLKKMIERSPLITSLSGVSLLRDNASSNTTSVQYLSRFEHLESIKFVNNWHAIRLVNGESKRTTFEGDILLIDLVEFMESTRSRATLKKIDIEECYIPEDDSSVFGHFDRLRAAFANDSNDPSRRLLELESISVGHVYQSTRVPLTFFDTLDVSRMTTLSFGNLHVEPAVLAGLINGAPRLRHIDFDSLLPCEMYDGVNRIGCRGRRRANKQLLAALESHPNLISLGIGVWMDKVCKCHRYEAEFKKMLHTIGPRLENFALYTGFPPANMMREIFTIVQIRMPRLKSLKIWGDMKSAEDLRCIADFKELENFELYCHVNNHEIMNDVLSTIIRKSPRLKRFHGPPGVHVSQGVVVELYKLNDLIDLHVGNNLTEENFVAFSQRVFAENLQVLSVGSIDDEGVESGLIEFISKAHKLRVLTAGATVTDRLLSCVAESCPNLETFYARPADGITFNGLQMLVDRCPKLRVLDVANAAAILDGSLENLKFDRYRKPPRFSL